VITSPITDMGTVIPILYQGATPVFAELDPSTITLSLPAVEAAITPRTRAILAVNLWGNACDLDALSRLCSTRGLTLIEDCAQALGAEYGGRQIGTTGVIGCFSLNEYKQISCGDGGIVITDDESLADRLRQATDKAYNRKPDALIRHPTFLAGNYRMTELQGAVAVAQLLKLDSIVSRRRAWCSELSRRLAGVAGLMLPTPTEGCDPSWWNYPMQVIPERLGIDSDGYAAALRAEGLPVGARYTGQCVYEYPVFTEHSAYARGGHGYASRQYGPGLCPVAECILRNMVLLTMNEAYTAQDLDETVEGVRRVAAWYRERRD